VIELRLKYLILKKWVCALLPLRKNLLGSAPVNIDNASELSTGTQIRSGILNAMPRYLDVFASQIFNSVKHRNNLWQQRSVYEPYSLFLKSHMFVAMGIVNKTSLEGKKQRILECFFDSFSFIGRKHSKVGINTSAV